MPFAKRELRPPLWLKHAAVALGVGVALAFLGPFGTQSALDRPVRYGFWIGLAVFGYVCVIASAAALRSSPVIARWPGTLVALLTTLVSAVPQTLATTWALSLVQPGRSFTPAELPALYVAVATVQLALTLVFAVVEGRTRAVPPALARRPADPQFLQRLPARLGRDLIALEAEDHYLRVHTSAGSELVLARLADAVAQLSGHDGLQVHRGWWVAAGAVTGVEARNGRTFVRLKNGIAAPVSRTYLQQVRARAWPPA